MHNNYVVTGGNLEELGFEKEEGKNNSWKKIMPYTNKHSSIGVLLTIHTSQQCTIDTNVEFKRSEDDPYGFCSTVTKYIDFAKKKAQIQEVYLQSQVRDKSQIITREYSILNLDDVPHYYRSFDPEEISEDLGNINNRLADINKTSSPIIFYPKRLDEIVIPIKYIGYSKIIGQSNYHSI